MNDLFQHLHRLRRFYLPVFLVGSWLLVLLLGINIGANLAPHRQPQQHPAPTAKVTQLPTLTPSSASPFLFGSNLDLSPGQDQVLTSPTFPALLQQMHVQMLRIPAYSGSSQTMVARMAQMIRDLGVTPLVVLHGSLDPHALTIDTKLVQTMNQLFGFRSIYYEFGDEDDAQGVNASHYVTAWNSIIPKLKPLAPQARFIGPASYQYSRDFLSTFLQQAKPEPDAISWHEYSCVNSWSKELCLSHLSDWTQHIADARATMQATLKSVLPIMITEWNYAANATVNDGKSNDSSFLTTWTRRAFQTLAVGHVFAAMQYSSTSGAAPLIESNRLAVEGIVLQQQYDQLFTKIAFEDGGMGGFGKSNTMTSIQNSTDIAWDGQHSLKITISNSTDKDYPTLWFDGKPTTANPRTGQTFVAYVYVPAGSIPPLANAYVLDSSHKQCDACHYPGWSVWVKLIPGKWTPVTYTVASGVSMPSTGYGISFTTYGAAPVNSTFYVDAIGWG